MVRRCNGFPALATVAHQPGQLERAQMFRHGRLRDTGKIGQGMDGLLAFAAQLLEDRSAGRIAEGFENDVGIGLHSQSITRRLLNCQRFDQADAIPISTTGRMAA